MKKIAACLIVFALAVSAYSENIINTGEKFDPNGIVTSKGESGFLKGVAYNFYYSDGSGSFAGVKDKNDYLSNWKVSCKKDPLKGYIYGMMIFSKGNLSVSVIRDGDIIAPHLSVGHSHFPKTTIFIKVDSQIFESNTEQSFTPAQTLEIIEKMKTAKNIVTRYQKWPYEKNIDSEFEIYGFNEAYSYINWAVKQIK